MTQACACGFVCVQPSSGAGDDEEEQAEGEVEEGDKGEEEDEFEELTFIDHETMCSVCGGSNPDIDCTQCRHSYHEECTTRMFDTAIAEGRAKPGQPMTCELLNLVCHNEADQWDIEVRSQM
jgi:hypothetical protein